MKELLKVIAPALATLAVGPFVGMVVAAVGTALGMDDPTEEQITQVLESGELTPEQIAAVRTAEGELRKSLSDLGLDLEKLHLELESLAGKAASTVNSTMRSEARSEHWPTYSWRPSIGFAVALNVAVTSCVVALAFGGVILLGRDAAPLAHIPSMIGAMAALIGVVSPILGIAAWFRGKMQTGEVSETPRAGELPDVWPRRARVPVRPVRVPVRRGAGLR